MLTKIENFFTYNPFVNNNREGVNRTAEDWKQSHSVENKDVAWRVSLLAIVVIVGSALALATMLGGGAAFFVAMESLSNGMMLVATAGMIGGSAMCLCPLAARIGIPMAILAPTRYTIEPKASILASNLKKDPTGIILQNYGCRIDDLIHYRIISKELGDQLKTYKKQHTEVQREEAKYRDVKNREEAFLQPLRHKQRAFETLKLSIETLVQNPQHLAITPYDAKNPPKSLYPII